MLFIIAAFICYTVILFSFGYSFLYLIEKLSKDKKISNYNFVDILFIGLFPLTMLLFILHFVVPINIYIFLIILFFSSLFFIRNIYTIKRFLQINSKTLIICGFVLIIVTFCLSLIDEAWDGKYYHMQYTESISLYPIIKGLGNLEDRFGFNSSAYLLQALFGFKSVLGFHYFSLNSYCYTIVLLYLVILLCKKFNLYSLVAVFVFSRWFSFDTTSNSDTLVTFLAFYLIIRLLFNENSFQKLSLLVLTLPCFMLVTKLSSGIFILFSLYTVYRLLLNRDYKYLSCVLSLCFIFGVLWCIRNVFISGYLIYPLYTVDLFDVDWKVPRLVAEIQEDYILVTAQNGFRLETLFLPNFLISILNKVKFINLTEITSYISIVMPIILTSLFINWKRERKYLWIMVVLMIGIYYSIILAPVSRFYYMYYTAVIFILLYLFLNRLNQMLHLKKIFIYKWVFVLIIICVFSLNLVRFFKSEFVPFFEEKNKMLSEYILTPQLKYSRQRDPEYMKLVNINNFTVYIYEPPIIELDFVYTYELFPTSHYTGFPYTGFRDFNPAWGAKIQHIASIELRGPSITDGFRTKKEYVEDFDKNKNYYFELYKNEANLRFNN